MSNLNTVLKRIGVFLRPSIMTRATAVMAAGIAAGGLAGGSVHAAAAGSTLVVGVDYVVPAFVAGAKVRTPEMPDTTIVEAMAEKLGTRVEIVPAGDVHATRGSASVAANSNGRAIALQSLPKNSAMPPAMRRIPTGYTAQAKVIMRTDTDIKSWAQLKGRTVCLSEGGHYVGKVAGQFGAIEQVYKAPADALLALRIGECDAALHDDTMLNALVKFPEWKKFSATLPADTAPRASLDFIVSSDDTDTITALRQLTDEWKTKRYLATLNVQRARDIAFEVYLDQTVSDCH
jgi:polar amino acid transport system substrate-binding protein